MSDDKDSGGPVMGRVTIEGLVTEQRAVIPIVTLEGGEGQFTSSQSGPERVTLTLIPAYPVGMVVGKRVRIEVIDE